MRRFAPLLPLPLLIAVAAWGSSRAADAAGASLASALGAVAEWMAVAPHDEAPDEELPAEPATIVPVSALATATERAPSKRRKPSAATQSAPRTLFVSAKTVLALSQARVMPRGTRVPARGKRPAGIRLSGVGALGIGLRDGDVLTRALGRPALSASEIIKAVLLARARRVKVLDGEFYRGEERWVLRVEQPYLDEAPARLTEQPDGPRLPAP